ncbi:MAG: sulfotransferase domain-containing protein [Rhodobacteraceae bacterium]|jgi:hypothetical protein|nr:sulfotransferase domain-containing protein [Paracoccaceae bacterium]
MRNQLPNFFIAGVPKAGTTTIFSWLADHPQAVGSRVKETCFFADPGTHVYREDFNTSHGQDVYLTAFPEPNSKTRLIFEATPSYIYSQTALEHIPDLPSKPKCLFVLREPGSQLQSLFTYYQNNWNYIPAGMSFDDFVDAILTTKLSFGGNELIRDALENATYLPWLKKWRARLGSDRMKVLTFDQLRHDPIDTMSELAAWCGIDPSFYGSYAFPISNESYIPRNRYLQSLNIALRDKIPRGFMYDLARKLYRSLNTRKPSIGENERALKTVRQKLAKDYESLAREFDLDLSRWPS